MEQQKSQIKPSPYLWGGLTNASLYTPSKEAQERLNQPETKVPYGGFNTEADFNNPDGFAVQAFLNSKGYNLEEDGNIGPKTRAAIADYKAKTFKKDFRTAEDFQNGDTRAIQQFLVDKGYLDARTASGYNNVDGKRGSRTNAAIQKYLADNQSTKVAGVRQDPTFLQNLGYYASSILGPLHDKSFEGTEEEARKLGYSTYKAPGEFKRHSVNYPVTVSESATPVEIAKAQFDQYGISSDYARDKSTWDKTMYEYLPGYGYNIKSFLENVKLDKKVSDASTGDRVLLGNQRRNKADDWVINNENPSFARKIYNKITGNNGVNYSVQDVSPARQDYRNLHWGYPQKHGTLTVNTQVTTKNDGSNFQGGYAFVPNDTRRILAQASNLHEGDLKYVKGNQLGNYAVGKNNKGESWYYDDWDLLGHSGSAFTGGRSFDVYDRI